VSHDGEGTGPKTHVVREELALLSAPDPVDFAARELERVGVPPDRYDGYLRLEAPAGGLYVAYSPHAVTGAVLGAMVSGAQGFEEWYHARTGRTAIRATRTLPGLRTAVRTGRAAQLRMDLSDLTAVERAVLDAVRTIPRGQLRPVAWVARDASLPDDAPVLAALANNPVALLIPCHRVIYDEGGACDLSYGPMTGAALRAAEGVDDEMVWLPRSGTAFLGSDTTRIYCHPTCAHARRITPPHQVPFRSASAAREAGYRTCKSCRPIAA